MGRQKVLVNLLEPNFNTAETGDLAALRSFTYGGNSAQNLPDVQLVQDCCLACRIQPQHDHLSRDTTPRPSLQHPKDNKSRSTAGSCSHPHLFVPKNFIEHLPEGVPHQLQ